MSIKISVIIPIYNEEKYISSCLNSIINSDIDKKEIEVLLIDGGSNDNTINIIKKYQNKYSFLKLLNNPKKIVPISMNIGIKKSRGEYIIRLDAHSSYPKDYFNKLIFYHKELNADNVGGIVLTKVKNQTYISVAIMNVLSDRLGVGSDFRSGISSIKEVDTVPFGCYKKEIFEKIGFYDERLIRNQDIELNKRIKRIGGKIYLIPNIQCIYYARETFKDLAKNNFANGKWNILTAFYTRMLSSLSIRHYIPLIFILSLILPLICCYKLSFFIFFIYLCVIMIRSWKINKNTTFFHQVLAFIVLHFSYSFGELVAMINILRSLIKKRFRVENRKTNER